MLHVLCMYVRSRVHWRRSTVSRPRLSVRCLAPAAADDKQASSAICSLESEAAASRAAAVLLLLRR
jgi:hypothetical protein